MDFQKSDFEEIYRRYFKDVYFFLLAMSKNPDIAEELTQDTFFKALKNIDNFRGECSVKSWLCQIGKNLYLTYQQKNRTLHSLYEAHEKIDYEDAEAIYVQKEESLSLYNVLKCLDAPYREVFILRTIGEMSFREIGSVFDQKEVWARVTFHRAKIKLKEQLSSNPL